MTLSVGTRLGPYEVLGLIGAGGMGEVYKAHDTRLNRTVAIKILPAPSQSDPERRQRFEREATTISQLNHPHICTLHDVGTHEGATFLVMEHLAGETLAERLKKGPLPVTHALDVAVQVADALAAAHKLGVIHRDLKPGNIMLVRDGGSGPPVAKLLDFGLAKLTGHGEQPALDEAAAVPTVTDPLTARGTILGTLPYMAPEQLEGKPADARTDLWALGTVLYEMVAGTRAFEGSSSVSLIGHIMHTDPPALATWQRLTPPALEHVVRKCLAKQAEDRWYSAHDVADELRWISQTGAMAVFPAASQGRRWGLRPALVIGGVLVAAMVGAAGVAWMWRSPAPWPSLTRLSLNVYPAEELNAGSVGASFYSMPGGSRTALTWTPDGQAVIFVGRRSGVQQLYVRRLDAAEARPLAGTETAQGPVVSADGQSVAFWARRTIKKVPLGGGPVMDLASGITSPPRGMVWDAAGGLLFGDVSGSIQKVQAEGAVTAVTTVGDAEISHSLPCLLPDGRALLYTARKRDWSWGDEEIVAQTLATGERTVLLRDAADARYLPTGHLVFLRRGVLFGVAFDARRLEVRGTPVALLDTVAQALTGSATGAVTGAGQFAISGTGTLAWLPGLVVPYPESLLVAVDRRGQVSRLSAPARSYGPIVRVSPDGRRLAVGIQSLTEEGLWLYDLGRGVLTPLVRDGEARRPLWSPDGQRLLFNWLKDGRRSLAAQAADGSRPPEVLVALKSSASSVMPDGRQVATAGDGDVMIVTLGPGEASVKPWLQTSHTEQYPTFRPDGHWLAYGSNVSGRSEVYVRPYPGPGSAEQVSVEGGSNPAWHPNGRELFFVGPRDPAGDYQMMAVDVEPGSPPHIGRPRPLFTFDNRDVGFACSPVRCFDVAPDGQRFYVVQTPLPPPAPVVTHINLVLNWFEELKAKVPVK